MNISKSAKRYYVSVFQREIKCINEKYYYVLKLDHIIDGHEIEDGESLYFLSSTNRPTSYIYDQSAKQSINVYCLKDHSPFKLDDQAKEYNMYYDKTNCMSDELTYIQDMETLETFCIDENDKVIPIDMNTVDSVTKKGQILLLNGKKEILDTGVHVNIGKEKDLGILIPDPLIFYTDQLISEIKKYIVCQDQAVEAFATLIARNSRITDYFKRKKHNGLFLGPSGVGKTELIRVVSKLTDIPFYTVNISEYSQTGYVGKCVSSIYSNLFNAFKEKAYRAIVYLDEIDKLALNDTNTGDVSTTAVQQELLPSIEGRGHEVQVSQDKNNTFAFNTSWITFIGGGAFSNLYRKKRKASKNIGFKNEEEKKNNKGLITFTNEEIVGFGFMDEFIARFPSKIFFNNFDEEDLYRIMKESKTSSYLEYMGEISDFVAIDYTRFDEKRFLMEVAKKAMEEKVGARSIDTILENAFKNIIRDLYSSMNYKDLYFDHTILEDNTKYTLTHHIK